MQYKLHFLLPLLLIGCAALAQRGRLMQRIIEKKLDKNAAENTGPAPDYSQLYYWAGSPYKEDMADSIPAFLKAEKRDSSADVFFIHPTTFIKTSLDEGGEGGNLETVFSGGNRKELISSMEAASWNANVDDTALNNHTDEGTILNQAAVFNGSCRVFAPRYRQANLKAFVVRTTKEAEAAFDLAYSDIKRAFQYYLDHDNHGRPIIIASHSQGSLHAKRLLKEFFDGRKLEKQLVCAYIIGQQIETDAFKTIPVCETAASTGCFIGWRSFQKGEAPKMVMKENGNSVCVNPLTWSATTTWADSSLNRGSFLRATNIIGRVGAGIAPDTKILWVSLPADAPDKLLKLKNLHVLDYNLFWMNIRQNVKQRVTAWFTKNNSQ